LERRLYELARKQCGTQPEWKCGLDKLKARTGSTSSDKEFRRLVRAICKADEEHNHMPDYAFRLDADILTVIPKPEFLESYAPKPEQNRLTRGYVLPLSPDTFERARELAPTWDIKVLVGEWQTYAARQKEPTKNPDAAFLGFCKSWFKKRGRNGW